MAQLHYLMYAERKDSLLVVLQGLHAAGEDGVVRHIFTGINPAGCVLSDFKQPTPRRVGPRFSLARASACAGKRFSRYLQSVSLRRRAGGVATPIIVAEFHIQLDVVGLVGASLAFAAVTGAGVGRPMPDHFGRKKSMLADMIIIGAGASIRALAKGPAMLFVGQLLVETGVGIDFPVSSSYVSEILPQRSRARMMVATTACQSRYATRGSDYVGIV